MENSVSRIVVFDLFSSRINHGYFEYGNFWLIYFTCSTVSRAQSPLKIQTSKKISNTTIYCLLLCRRIELLNLIHHLVDHVLDSLDMVIFG